MKVKLLCAILSAFFVFAAPLGVFAEEGKPAKTRWVNFDVTAEAMAKAMDFDIQSYGDPASVHVDWVTLLAISGTRNGGRWKGYDLSQIEADAARLAGGESPEEILAGYTSYDYYHTAYKAVLGAFLGEHLREVPDRENPGQIQLDERYGLKAYSPIAEGYGYSHHKDFGNSRSYGYRRKHFGNDLIGSVGTPIIAMEGGKVEELGWNRYGGWRVGIRSHDGLRYYYYAHLRKDHPWPVHLEKGMTVQGGDVVGYLGMTGYSTKENVNGMKIPHLHFGLQLVLDDSERDGYSQNWIDVYELVRFLSRNRATVIRYEESKDYERKYRLFDYHYASGD